MRVFSGRNAWKRRGPARYRRGSDNLACAARRCDYRQNSGACWDRASGKRWRCQKAQSGCKNLAGHTGNAAGKIGNPQNMILAKG